MSVEAFLRTGEVVAFLSYEEYPELITAPIINNPPPVLLDLTPDRSPAEKTPQRHASDELSTDYNKLVADYFDADLPTLETNIESSNSYAKKAILTKLYNDKLPKGVAKLRAPEIKNQQNLATERDILKNIILAMKNDEGEEKKEVKNYATDKLLEIRRKLSFKTQVEIDRLNDLLRKRAVPDTNEKKCESIYPAEAKKLLSELQKRENESVEEEKFYTWKNDNPDKSLEFELVHYNSSFKPYLLDDELPDAEREKIVENYERNLILLNILRPPLTSDEIEKISNIDSRLHGMETTDPDYDKLVRQRDSIAGSSYRSFNEFLEHESTAFENDPDNLLRKAKQDLADIKAKLQQETPLLSANEKKKLREKYNSLAVKFGQPTLKQLADAIAAENMQAKMKRLLDASELKLTNEKIARKKEIEIIEKQVDFLNTQLDGIASVSDYENLKETCNTMLTGFENDIPLIPCESIALQKNQASVFFITKLRAENKINTPGVLVKHGTGSGKTVCGLITLLNFWNTVWKDENGKFHLWAIFFVSTAKNQDEDNDIFKQAGTLIKFFPFFTTRYYNGKEHDHENAIFSTEFYQANKNNRTHVEFVAKLLINRISMGYNDSFLKSVDEIKAMPDSDQIDKLLDERQKFLIRRGEKPLTTYGKLGYDFATTFWPEDRHHFENTSLRVKEKMDETNKNEISIAVNAFLDKNVAIPLQKFLKESTSVDRVIEKVNGIALTLFNNNHLPFKQNEIKNDYSAMIANTREWNTSIQNVIWQKMDESKNKSLPFYIKTVDNAYTSFLSILQKYGIVLQNSLKYEKNVYTFKFREQISSDEVEIINDDDNEDDDDVTSKQKKLFSTDDIVKNAFREEALYLKVNTHRQVQHCVFILDEVQQMFDVAAKEAGKKIDYDRCQYALKYYRDPKTTYVVALTATPGSTDSEVANIMSMVSSSSDVFLEKNDQSLRILHNPIFENVEKTVADSKYTRTIVKKPGQAKISLNSQPSSQLEFNELPTEQNPYYRFRIQDTFTPLHVLADIESIHQPFITYVDFSGDHQRYADLTIIPKLVKHSKAYNTLFENSAKIYRKQLHDFDEKQHNNSRWLNSSKLAERTIASKFMAFNSYYGVIDNGVRLSPMQFDGELQEGQELLTFPKRKRLAFFRALNLFCKTDSASKPSKYTLKIIDGRQHNRLFVPSEKFMTILADVLKATGFPDLYNIQKGIQKDELKKAAMENDDSQSEASDDDDEEKKQNKDAIQFLPTLKTLLEPTESKIFKPPGKHYIYCSTPFALYAFAYYLHFYSKGYLQPYNNEDLATLLDQKRKGIRYFYYTEEKKTTIQPFNMVCVDDHADPKKGKKIAASDITFEDYRKLYPNEPTFKIESGKDLVNIKGNLIPIILATGESYKGVDMKGITDLYAMDSFLDMQDLIQFMGRGPRMCSHSMLNPDQRHVRLHLYFADRFSHTQLDPDEKENTDLWLLKESQIVYKSFLEKNSNAFANSAYDKDSFEEIHRKVEETKQILLNLDPKTFVLPEKNATKKSIDTETIKEAIKSILDTLPERLFEIYFDNNNAKNGETDDDYDAMKKYLLDQIGPDSPFGNITILFKDNGVKKTCEFTIPFDAHPIVFSMEYKPDDEFRNFKERLKSRLKFYMCDAWLAPSDESTAQKNGDIFSVYTIIQQKLESDVDRLKSIYIRESKPPQ